MGASGRRSGTLSDADLMAVGSHGIARSYPKNTVIVSEGDRTDSLYVILEGRVKVYVSDDDGRDVVLATQGPGEYFGELVLDEGPRSASVMTLEPATCSVVTRVTLKDHISKHPEFAFELLAKVIRRARRATESARDLALLDVYGRVRRLFDSLAVEREGVRLIPEKLTHQEIADRVGSSREMVSRLLKDLAEGGYISVSEKLVTLRKPLPPNW
jgi:CRP/FNR family cyclic AMP-dependent transcriptional regulator